MQLQFSHNDAVANERGIHFPLEVDGTRYRVMVTHEALQDIEQGLADQPASLDRFERHRNRVEALAAAKIRASKLPASEPVEVCSADVR